MIWVRRHRFGSGTGHGQRLWPVLLLLLVVTLVPAGGVLWFMRKAVDNERLAARQKLAEAYRGHLSIVQQQLENYWRETAKALDGFPEGAQGSSMFAHCVRAGLADSAVCYDARGRPIYPHPPRIPRTNQGGDSAAWNQARRLEQSQRDFTAAAQAYAAIAKSEDDSNISARALQAEARCLTRAGQKDKAIHLITETLGQERYRQGADPQGRLIVADAELMALQLIGTGEDGRFLALARRLNSRLVDYENPALPAAQRRFLMRQMQSLPVPAEMKEFPTLEAEDLAARLAESHPSPPPDTVVRPSELPGVWQLASPGGRVLALYRHENLIARMRRFMDTLASPADVAVTPHPPGEEIPRDTVFHSLPAGSSLPGWRLSLALKDSHFLDAATDKQVAAYMWVGSLVIAVIAVLATLIGGTIRRQMRLAKLKNDLVATVTHELKTPLSSIRLLVDTLLDDERFDSEKTREYLQLVSRENNRLSRLIDNFLAFSRMERNKRAFDFRETKPSEVVNTAVEAVQERFHSPGCRFEVEMGPELPDVIADPDAMVTVVLNLLDNAFKYTGAEKHIVLRSYAEDGNVCFEVQDNGIGLSQRDAKKVFKRFYQADQRLSRTTGGVGLGLSIVEFIAGAHGGRVRVNSQPGQGSTFTVTVPSAPVRSAEKAPA